MSTLYRAGLTPPNIKGIPVVILVFLGLIWIILIALGMLLFSTLSMQFSWAIGCTFVIFLACVSAREIAKDDMHGITMWLKKFQYTGWKKNKKYWGAPSLSPLSVRKGKL